MSCTELSRLPTRLRAPFNTINDIAGNRTLLIYPDLKTVHYSYDDAGRLKSVEDWSSQTTTYTY